MRIRALLLIVAAIVFIPGFLAAIVAVEQVREGEREAALRGLRETVRASALLVDREVQRSIGAMTGLAQSDHLRTGNFKAFYEQALAINQPHVWTLLLDESGMQVLNTAVPFGTAPPQPGELHQVATALATGRVFVSEVITGPTTGKLVTTLYLPTKVWNGKRYVLAQAFSVDHWKATALSVENSSDVTIAVIDKNGKFISRNKNSHALLGKPARPELVAAAASSSEGLIRHRTLEGVESYDAFTRSELTGWTVAVASPVEKIDSSATRSVIWLGAAGVIALTAAIIAASLLGHTFIHVIAIASRATASVGRGGTPVIARSRLHEVNDLYGAIAEAGESIAAERRFREAAEKERNMLLARETALREEAQKQNTAKDHFLALLGHELRNPLAAITGATSVLGHSRTTPEAKEKFLAIIQRQNRHLTRIVDDLLDVSRLMSGKIVLESTLLNLADCVRRCVEALRASDRASGRQISIQSEDVWVNGDAVRLEQIVNNLVSNSLKFSAPDSEIRVLVHSSAEQAILEVVDTGIGIDASLMPHVFEPFVQGPPRQSHMTSGLGIGLALVKQLVELHGGQVTAESRGRDCGTTVRVVIPKVAQSSSMPVALHQGVVAQRRVLLVEDDLDAMETTSELLRLIGHSVIPARNHAEVRRTLETQSVDIVVMDIGLPGKDGYQIASELRQMQKMQAVPIVALTGFGQQTDRFRALASGFDDHITKPVSQESLMRVIDERTSGRSHTQ